ncbi:tyrosine-type recombinase/integrase [Clostridium sp. AT4]|uniref:tyrosine-type recombinase/integrase n=2 Tax=Clostridia TaxID=186801 RepID=UPI00083247FD|nr:tyrosine-type recombinase/integrase [Clostridium sp. AT4]
MNLDTGELSELIEMTKQQKLEKAILKEHIENFYHIWQNDKGVYLTYLPAKDKPKGRKAVSASTQERLERKIIDFYLEQKKEEEQGAITLRKLYPQWLKIKSLETTASTYIRRIDNDWKRYYEADPIIDKDIKKFTKAYLKEWALSKIREKSLTKKQYYNMAVIIRHILEYAVENEWIPTNLYKSFKIEGKLFRKVKKPEDETQVFLITEQPMIEAEAWKDFYENGYTTALAIPLAFQIGVRLGELTALKTTDLCRDGKYIHIQRMAQKVERQRPDGTWYPTSWATVDHVKSSAGDRYVYLTKEARRIIKIIMDYNAENHLHEDDFLFFQRGKHITPTAIITRLRKYCNHIDTKQKGVHKIRKSYISALLDAGININEIRKQVGHEDERTTLHNYAFNRVDPLQNEADMERALAI